MLAAGVPLAKVIDCQAEFSQDESIEIVLQDIGRMISQGRTLSAAMRAYPKIFSSVSLAMVELGEATGVLVGSLARVGDWMERDLDIRKRIGSALVYPAFSLGLTLLLTLTLFIFVVPDFLGMLVGMGAKVPLPTQILVLITSFLTSPLGWGVMVLGAVFLVSSLRAILQTRIGLETATRMLFALPVLGPLALAGGMARYAAAAETMLACGTDIFTMARLSALASGNFLLQADVVNLSRSISEGESLSAHMAGDSSIYPGPFAQFCSVGEETARMAEIFAFLRDYYDNEVNHRLSLVTAMMEPLIMALLAMIIGFVVIALLLPMHNLLSTLG